MTATSLSDALKVANDYWGSRPGGRVMGVRAATCIAAFGPPSPGCMMVSSMTPSHGVNLLTALQRKGLSPAYVQACYNTFRRMLALNGVSTVAWPKAPAPSKRTRDALTDAEVMGLRRALDWCATGDLVTVLAYTGLRIDREGLREGALRVTPGEHYDVLHITGKGGHEREVPVLHPQARDILTNPQRLAAIRSQPYRTHLRRFKAAVEKLGITSRLATPHALRHYYACEAYRKSGNNLVMVKELLGHSSPETTARYLHVDHAAKAEALANP